MPIRFRCVYCNQLLGISRRKAGNVVRCTNCGGQIIVPDAQPKQSAAVSGQATRKQSGSNEPNVFEHSDIETLLKPLSGEHRKLEEASAQGPSSQELFSLPENRNEAQPVAKSAARTSNQRVLILVGSIALLIGLTIGYFVGRSMAG